MTQILENTQLWLETVIAFLGYPGIALVMLIETVFPPIPSEMVMPMAGFMVSRGAYSFLGVLTAGTLGSLGGAVVLYWLGSKVSEARLRLFLRRYGYWLLLSERDLARALALFGRYDGGIVLLARLLPGVRSLISLPAGLTRMPFGRFLIYTLLGTALWNSVLITCGLLLGRNWNLVTHYVESYQLALAVIAVLFILGVVAARLRNRRAKAYLD